MLEATVAAMVGLGADPRTIAAAIGPCIGQASYEVGADLSRCGARAQSGTRAFLRPWPQEARWQFDLPGYCAARLADTGIRCVAVIDADTAADEAQFFSHRRRTLGGGGPIGHQISIISLDP